MTATISDARLQLALRLTGEHTNEWDGSAPVKDIARARFAVIIERDDDAWVLAANTAQDVANIALSTLTGTEGYDEWISEVWDVPAGEQITWSQHTAVTVEIDGHTAIAQA